MDQLNTSQTVFEDTSYSNTMIFSKKQGFAIILLDLNGQMVGSLTSIPHLGYESYGVVSK